MSEPERIRDYFEGRQWTTSLGRRHVYQERVGLLRKAAERIGLPLAALGICDVGCGEGHDLAAWRDAGVPEGRLAGTELSPRRAAVARERLPEADIRDVGDFTLPFDDAAFDLCSASLVLSSIQSAQDRVGLLLEMRRVTRLGGTVVVYDFAVRKPTNRHVAAVTTRWLRRAWRRPDHIDRAAPLLPLLEPALKMPDYIERVVVNALPRTHRMWIWTIGVADV